ncbi:MAG TPA: flagellar biosynthetic protein FliR [Tepidisphaeraceae bacterium]|jgi:flagellar biosynthetic protein FliR
MSLDVAIHFVPTFVLVFFRITGLMLFAPLLGSARIPRRVKVLIALVLAAAMCSAVKPPVVLPQTIWELTLGIGGEMAFGLAMGMVLSFTFIAAQWAGEMIGQQMGLNLSEVFDPAFGGAGSLIGDFYFLLTLTTFLIIGGHRQMIQGIWRSFEVLPLLSLGIDRPLLDTLVGLFQSCTTLAVQLAAPMLVTMLVVDLALGCIGKTMPQINVMTAGLTIRTLLGMVVMLVGVALTVEVVSGRLSDAMSDVQVRWTTP